jgi:hypothetical protein
VKKVFSPAQGSIGAFLGGPVAGTYFVAMNSLALGNVKRARLATILGIVITAASLLWHFFLLDRPLGYSIRIAYLVAAWLVIGRTQFTKPQIVASATLTFHSNGRVADVVLLGTLIMFALAWVVTHFLSHG